MKRLLFFILAILCFAGPAYAAEWTGSLGMGAWYLRNNLQDNANVPDNDLLEKDYSLFLLNFKTTGKNLFSSDTNLYIDASSLLNPLDKTYSLGVEQNRFEIRQFALELKNITDSSDLWLGRQLIFEAGAIGVDGLRSVLHLSEHTDLGLYAGLGSNPRSYLGYIGPYYEWRPFNVQTQALGAYTTVRGQKLHLDFALNALGFDFKLDRLFSFTQASYNINPVWTLSALVQYSMKGFVGPESLQASIITRPSKKFTNTLSFYRFTALQYPRSQVSIIPVTSNILDPTPVGNNQLNTTSYNTLREHMSLNLLNNNYIFASAEYSKRTFDNLTRKKFTMGFHEPELFSTNLDFRVQTDLIQNYRGFNSSVDLLLGKNFMDGKIRVDTGATLFSNERDVYNNYASTNTLRQSDEEYALRGLLTWIQGRKTTWNLSYTFFHEVDADNNNAPVNTHELFLMTYVSF